MRELDQLMLRYLDRRWLAADDAERSLFLRILDTEDDKLWRWFMGRRLERRQLQTGREPSLRYWPIPRWKRFSTSWIASSWD